MRAGASLWHTCKVIQWLRLWRAMAAASAAGLVAITVYLVVERSIATGISVVVATEQLLQWDASNGYGRAAFFGGWSLATIGLLMDAVVSTCWAALFVLLYIAVPQIRRNLTLYGLLFGALVMCMMIYIVVPIGHATPAPRTLASTINVLIAHTVFFGLPLAYVAAAVLRPQSYEASETRI